MSTVVCVRPSSLSLDDKSGLIKYVAANTLKTISANPDLQSRLALTHGDWKAYSPLVKEADERGGSREASEGTNIHAIVASLHSGYDVSQIPEPTRSDGLAIWETIDELGFDVILSEQFVYCPGLHEPCAGTLDLLLESRSTGNRIIADVKSVGKPADPKYKAVDWGIQTSIYSRGLRYDEEYRRDRWGRPVLDPELAQDWEDGEAPSQDVSLILQVTRGEAEVIPYWVDINAGYKLAKVAMNLRIARKAGSSLVLDRPEEF